MCPNSSLWAEIPPDGLLAVVAVVVIRRNMASAAQVAAVKDASPMESLASLVCRILEAAAVVVVDIMD
jgi:hypothetical protein